MNLHSRPWLLVVGATLGYDAWLIRWRSDSLSRHFADARRRRPVLVFAAVVYVLAHLYGAIPRRADVFLYGARQVQR